MAKAVTAGNSSVRGSQKQAPAIVELFALQVFPTLAGLLNG